MCPASLLHCLVLSGWLEKAKEGGKRCQGASLAGLSPCPKPMGSRAWCAVPVSCQPRGERVED